MRIAVSPVEIDSLSQTDTEIVIKQPKLPLGAIVDIWVCGDRRINFRYRRIYMEITNIGRHERHQLQGYGDLWGDRFSISFPRIFQLGSIQLKSMKRVQYAQSDCRDRLPLWESTFIWSGWPGFMLLSDAPASLATLGCLSEVQYKRSRVK